MDTWTDEHGRLVAATAPPVDAVDLDGAWARVAGEIDDRTPVRRRRPIRIVVGAGVAALVVGISGVAAADFINARTGEGPVDQEDLALGGPGERLDPSAADFRQVLVEETSDIPFPSQAARQVSIDEHDRDLHGRAGAPGTESVSTGALRGWTAIHAVCAWADEWVVTGRDGDVARHAKAARMLVEARQWPAITDIATTQFSYLRQVAEAVESEDVTSLGSTLAANAYCIGPSLVPDFPQALPPGFRGR